MVPVECRVGLLDRQPPVRSSLPGKVYPGSRSALYTVSPVLNYTRDKGRSSLPFLSACPVELQPWALGTPYGNCHVMNNE
jgi:hypothetical protein